MIKTTKDLKINAEDLIKVEVNAMNMLNSLSHQIGKEFELNLWYKDLNEEKINYLMDKYKIINSISRLSDRSSGDGTCTFFIIHSTYDTDININYRYKYNGGIIEGIEQYKNVVEFINSKKDFRR
tara:strand:+ start:1389 stop:1763 length:375 start_codon:yes stop_codon:yes gene_type:complete